MKKWIWAVSALILVSCVQTGAVQVMDPSDLPADIYASPSPTPSPEGATEVGIFLARGSQLVRVSRVRESKGNDLEFSIRSLLEGPIESELAAGLGTAIPEDVELLRVTTSEGVATIDISSEFEAGAEEEVLILRIAQVVYTATELGSVRSVSFMIDGEPIEVLAGDGVARTGPVGRSDYPGLLST